MERNAYTEVALERSAGQQQTAVSAGLLVRSRAEVGLWAYLLVGTLFGLTLLKTEAVSWYRIQEMFRFQAVHMYGVIGSAVLVGMLSTWLLRRTRRTALGGEDIVVAPKAPGVVRYVAGGLLFGLGWGLAGVCPGPIFILIGAGVAPMLIVLLFALLGTWLYGAARHKLPH